MEEQEEEDRYPDEIFKRGHLTTAEKLMFANRYVEDLKKEVAALQFKVGVLESEKSELVDANNKIKYIVKKNREEDEKGQNDNNELLKEIKKDEYVKQLSRQITKLNQKTKDLYKSNRDLLYELVQLRYNNKPNNEPPQISEG